MKIKKTANSLEITWKDFQILRHTKKRTFVELGIGEDIISHKHGNFKINEKTIEKIGLKEVFVKKHEEKEIILSFSNQLYGKILEIIFEMKGPFLYIKPIINNPKINRMYLNIPATEEEAIYGCGEQFSEINLRGHKIPLWSSEQGVGRGDPRWFTFLANLFKNAGGNHFTTYYPQPTYVSSKNYFLHVDTYAYTIFNFKNKSFHQLYFWDIPNQIVLGKFETPVDTVTHLTNFLGIQPELPEWVYDGLTLGVQGGPNVVDEKINICKKANVKVNAVWCQDWQGIRITSFGQQLFWDWQYDDKRYPNLPKYIKELEEQNIAFLGYINPLFTLDGELYKEASDKDFFVKNQKGEEYIIVPTTFPVAIFDFTNPEGVKWLKQVIKENMIDIGMKGWMVDYGEYLPADAILYSGVSAKNYFHNRFPVEWAKINFEAIEESQKEDIIFFIRAGYSYASKYAPMVWAGDQLVNWSMHDGLASVIPAGISLGICGIGYYHFDIGGFTTLGPFKRSKEVFMRWTELAVFTMMMRTHEGNRPTDNWQFDADQECLNHLARMTQIHVKLKPYLIHLSQEYQEKGLAPIRALYLHYEEDLVVHDLKYQYLFGRDLLVAPVIKPRRDTWKVYLPKDEWVHLWSGKEHAKGWFEVSAPLGEPPVFYRKNSQFCTLFESLKEK